MFSRHRFTLLVVVLLAVAATPALAAKGGGASGGGSSIQLVMVSSAGAAASSRPSFGNEVTYAVSTSRTNRPWVSTRCYQNGTLALDDWRGMFEGYVLGQVVPLGPTGNWTGGAATCTARLVSFDGGGEKTLASMSFDVSA
jgi:hypothetical protein